MRPKARELVSHGGPPGWLEESDPAGCNFVRDEWLMSPALTDHTTCPKAKFLDIIGTKVLRVFLLTFTVTSIKKSPPPPEQKWFKTDL
jgi:hypothetical protein